jgi:hypothetical protein
MYVMVYPVGVSNLNIHNNYDIIIKIERYCTAFLSINLCFYLVHVTPGKYFIISRFLPSYLTFANIPTFLLPCSINSVVCLSLTDLLM